MHMKTELKENKGITLIALVITIIVLLILAGIAISMLSGENGILNQAIKAKEETENKSTEEAIQLSVIGAMSNTNYGIKDEDLRNELKSYFGEECTIEGNEEEGWTVGIEENDYFIMNNGTIMEKSTVEELMESKENTKMKTMVLDSEQKRAIIPEGFHLAEDSALTVKEGIVIEDNIEGENKNQFVWIPVEDITTMCEQQDGRNVGILYDWNNGGTKIEYSTNGYREPDVLEDITDGDKSTTKNRGLNLLKSIVGITGDPTKDADKMIEIWKKQLQKEFDAMIESVKINKGFYVGRYETSFEGTYPSITKMYSKKGEVSATAENSSANTWYGLYKYQKLYTNDKVVSSMIWGCQYDQMMRWMQGNNIDVVSTTPIAGAEKNTERITGKNDKDQLNKVYDLLGNNFEWSIENYATNGRVHRRRKMLHRNCT